MISQPFYERRLMELFLMSLGSIGPILAKFQIRYLESEVLSFTGYVVSCR